MSEGNTDDVLDRWGRVDAAVMSDVQREGLRLSHENEQLEKRLAIVQERLTSLLRSASIWRAWWNGKGGPQSANLAEKVDVIATLERNDPHGPQSEGEKIAHDADGTPGQLEAAETGPHAVPLRDLVLSALDDPEYRAGFLDASFKQFAAWLRSSEAQMVLRTHRIADPIGRCACGQPYTSYPRHLLDELAKAVEA